jgi:hypothetical protein
MRLPTFLSSRVRRLPIGIQLALAFTLVLSLTAALGGFSVLSLVQLNNASHKWRWWTWSAHWNSCRHSTSV